MPDPDVAAVRELYAEWFAAMESGDVERCIDLVTSDVLTKGPSGSPTRGRAALAQRLTAFQEQATETVRHDVREVEVSHDLAIAWVEEHATVTPRDGSEPFVARGVHLAFLRREDDGCWRIAKEVASVDDS